MIKDIVRNILQSLLKHRIVHHQGDNLSASAIVFSPHKDDETLGCGGTIVKKVAAGAQVRIVFFTDGRRSHRHLMAEESLVTIRTKESIAAARVLGIKKSDIVFLEFPDGDLMDFQPDAVPKVIEILEKDQPDEIYIPYFRETTKDHFAVNLIVKTALKRYGKTMTVFEYPVWFWSHWPWANLPLDSRRDVVKLVQESVISTFYLLRDLKYAVSISEVLAQKRQALEMYKSQMTRLLPDKRWRTLRDVANGDWLECFFQKFEVFYKWNF